MTRILGIDPGSRHLGWGVVDAEGSRMQHVAHGVIAPGARLPLPERLAEIFRALEEVVAQWEPQAAAIEQVFVNAPDGMPRSPSSSSMAIPCSRCEFRPGV